MHTCIESLLHSCNSPKYLLKRVNMTCTLSHQLRATWRDYRASWLLKKCAATRAAEGPFSLRKYRNISAPLEMPNRTVRMILSNSPTAWTERKTIAVDRVVEIHECVYETLNSDAESEASALRVSKGWDELSKIASRASRRYKAIWLCRHVRSHWSTRSISV